MNDPRSHASRPDDTDRTGRDRPDADHGDESAMERADRANGEPDAQEPGA